MDEGRMQDVVRVMTKPEMYLLHTKSSEELIHTYYCIIFYEFDFSEILIIF